MTRDEVLEEAALALEGAGGRLEACGFDRQAETVRMDVLVVRALKSKPPEKSPEVECAGCIALRLNLQIEQGRLAEAQVYCSQRRAVESERDALKTQLEASERRWEAKWLQEKMNAKKSIAELEARVEALTAEVKHREWVEIGAPMPGEPGGGE